jgi:hypothetical protein
VSDARGPLLGCNFLVEMDGAGLAFAQAILPRLDPAGDPSPLILRRGATGADDLYKWTEAERTAPGKDLRTITISALTTDRSARPLVWRFTKCRPVALGFSMLDALSSETLMETIELAYEKMAINPPPPRRIPVRRPR